MFDHFFAIIAIFCGLSLAVADWKQWTKTLSALKQRKVELRCAHHEGQRLSALANIEAALATLRQQNHPDLDYALERYEYFAHEWKKPNRRCEAAGWLWQVKVYKQNAAAHPSPWPNWSYVVYSKDLREL